MNRFLVFCLLSAFLVAAAAVKGRAADEALTMVVMDPLSKPLSCDCVQGHAQRDYNALGEHLAKSLGRPVKVVWLESLAEALRETGGKADIVVGKHSIVLADEKSTGHEVFPVASLSGKDGSVTQKGLIVVRHNDAANDMRALSGYRVLFGPTDAEEKSSAVERALQKSGVKIDAKRERFGACSEAANALLKLPADVDAAAVISSYAEPLLEGCGSIDKGDLRVVGETAPVPFITAFLSDSLPDADQKAIQFALLTAGTDPIFLKRMETLAGFLPWEDKKKTTPGKTPDAGVPIIEDASLQKGDDGVAAPDLGWNQFRGPMRDGTVDELPSRLPNPKDDLLWSYQLPSDGIGGIAAVEHAVIVGGRNAEDTHDRFVALDPRTGRLLWQHQYPAGADLDYGNSPRATPCVTSDTVITCGATGILSSLDLSSGRAHWTVNLSERFRVPAPTWGFSSSPLVRNKTIYLQLGKESALVALDLETGATLWKATGDATAYASLSYAVLAGQPVVVGVDQSGYFARDVKNGELLWHKAPDISGDFGVPSPVVTETSLVFASENNGIQAFELRSDALAGDPPVINDYFFPESHTPTYIGGQLLVAYEGLHSLDPSRSLRENWAVGERFIGGYASVIASEGVAMVTTEEGMVLLVRFDHGSAQIVDQQRFGSEKQSLLSHPAIDNNRLVLRLGRQINCYALR